MTNKDKKSLEDSAFDLLLYEAFQEISKEEQEHYAELAKTLPDSPTPKLDKAIKHSKRKGGWKKALRFTTTAAAILLVLFSTHLLLYSNVEAYRFQFQQIFAKYSTGDGGVGSINLADSEDNAAIVEVTLPTEGFPFALWIPQSYQLKAVNEFDAYLGRCEYKNDVGESISFNYVMHENNTMELNTNNIINFDTEDSEIEKIFIHGNEGLSQTRKARGEIAYRIIWYDANYTFYLYGSFKEDAKNYEEILKTMAKSISYEE